MSESKQDRRKEQHIQEGDKVEWNWAGSTAAGTIKSIFHTKTTRHIKGTEVVKHGTKDNPALMINQDDGDRVLKLLSEVEKAEA